MLRPLILLLLLSLICAHSFAQSQESTLFPARTDIELAIGSNQIKFRDFATSPLFFKGPAGVFSAAYLKRSEDLDVSHGLIISAGNLFGYVEESAASVSFIQSSQLYTSRMYNIDRYSDEHWNVKAGGMFNGLYNIRENASLRNNSVGFETIITLFGSGEISRDVSRKKRKKTEFWFISYILPPRLRTLSYRMDLALLNVTYRNDYIYTNQTSLVNDDNYFDDYTLSFFSGYRVRSTLEYLIYMKNDNAFMFSYEWDALKTGGELDKFEMSNHILKFSLLFNLR